MRRLLSGNEAIALGAYHAGVKVAASYPGTPSTEILEALTQFPGIYTEWSVNEKVALEVALGACYSGVRAMASMKMVGLNVAADPFFAAAITGVRGGLVVVSADDPGMHSSQNEQDNRHYARFAKVPLIEACDSQEAYELMQAAFDISERFDTPVLFRSTTRICHCKTVVSTDRTTPIERPTPAFQRDPRKLVMVPAYARARHVEVERRVEKLARFAETFPGNVIEWGDRSLGVVASGIAYQYAREVLPGASFLKLGMSYPLPNDLVLEFAAGVERLIVVEELDPFMEEALLALGLKVAGKAAFPILGELSTELVRKGAVSLGLATVPAPAAPAPALGTPLPARPPVLCAGCPHTGLYYTLKRMGFYSPDDVGDGQERRRVGVVATGDIGCYTLGALPPLLALDTCGCMGASLGGSVGLLRAGIPERVVAVIGDSTFMHSGITGLLNAVYNRTPVTLIILDNGTTAMTGHQGHPGTGRSARGETVQRVDVADVARGVGVRELEVVNSYDLLAIEKALSRLVELDEPTVLVVRAPCRLVVRYEGEPFEVDADICNGCGACFRLGCPAISRRDGLAYIDLGMCQGEACGLCAAICPQEAISLRVRAKV